VIKRYPDAAFRGCPGAVGGGVTAGVDRLKGHADALPFERLPLGALHA
jgi:hypothetical protein